VTESRTPVLQSGHQFLRSGRELECLDCNLSRAVVALASELKSAAPWSKDSLVIPTTLPGNKSESESASNGHFLPRSASLYSVQYGMTGLLDLPELGPGGHA
jgi:hypothetical protein